MRVGMRGRRRACLVSTTAADAAFPRPGGPGRPGGCGPGGASICGSGAQRALDIAGREIPERRGLLARVRKEGAESDGGPAFQAQHGEDDDEDDQRDPCCLAGSGVGREQGLLV